MDEAHGEAQALPGVRLELPYIPDFLIDEMVLWFAPSLSEAREVYHELVGRAAADWTSYYTKRGWNFVTSAERRGEGPFRIPPEDLEIWILPPARIFAPRPRVHFRGKDKPVPIVSLPKQKPLNPWKPNYIQALNFIRRYEWPHPLPRSVHYAVWEIEECGQIAGSVSWRTGERILQKNDSPEVRETLADLFYNRPEDYPLGSEVYLRVLGRSGKEGFSKLLELADHPVSRKRKVVANTLGELRRPEGVGTLLKLLRDEDPDVRRAALRAIGKVGIRREDDAQGEVAAYLESAEIAERVWAAQAFVKGGDRSHEKFLIGLVKEEPRLLTDMGELGDVLADLALVEAVPYCIARLKHDKSEFRADAAEALAKITGLNLEYQSIDTDEQRRVAIRTYSRWWEEKKKERRKKD